MNWHLGINTGFAVNRYVEPEVWTRIIGKDLDLRHAQMTAEMLPFYLPEKIIDRTIDEIKRGCEKYDVRISSTFTGAYTRVNHFAHPDQEVRDQWMSWFRKYVDMSVELGADSMGSHLGILTDLDNRDVERRNTRVAENIRLWQELASYAKDKGLKYLTWEPMSISREQGETLEKTWEIHHRLNESTELPILINLDVDHGDVTSPNPDDTDPYKWLSEFAKVSPLIHVKQSKKDKGGHWPFTKEHNKEGRVLPEKVIKTLVENGCEETIILLEFSFREREPVDSTVIEALKESVDFWKNRI